MQFIKLNTLKSKLFASAVIALISMLVMFLVYNYNFKGIVTQMTNSSFNSIAEEMERRLDSEITRIEDAAKLVSYSETVQKYLLMDNPLERFENLDFSLKLMDIAIQNSKNIVNITILPRNGRSAFYNNSTMQSVLWDALDDYGLSDSLALEESFFSKIYYYRYYVGSNSDTPFCYYFMPVYDILPGDFDQKNIAICAVLCNLSSIADEVASVFEDGASALIYENEIIASNRELDKKEKYILSISQEGLNFLDYNGMNYLTQSISVSKTDWRYIAITTRTELTKNLVPLRKMGLVLMFVAAVLISIILAISIRSITKPLNGVIHDMESLQSSDGSFRIRIPKEAEISQIASEINNMLERIDASSRIADEARTNLYKSKLAQQKAELLSYRSQINPHFLYNTLECLRSMAHEYNVPQFENLCVSLARLFQYSLSSGPVANFGEEIENTKNYFNIMSQRFPGKYKLIVDVPPNIIFHHMPAMILQPVVENCILHGFKEKKSDCIIKITANELKDGNILVRVIDNGSGMMPNEVEKVNNMLNLPEDKTVYGKNSIGLYNINQRIQHLFGAAYMLAIKSSPGHYTIIEIRIPMDIKLSVGN